MRFFIKKNIPIPTKVFDTYWKFAHERQNVFFNKIHEKQLLTEDKVILKHKFTNVYRASDRVSQYLINNIIYNNSYSEKDNLLRILLFKIFNKIETWQLLEEQFGEITLETFSFARFSEILSNKMLLKEPIYSAAYIMASGKNFYGYLRKHENHLKFLEQEIIKGTLFEKIKNAKSLEALFLILKTLPSFGDFLAFQIAIDINYSNITDFNEMDFVVAGPGAKDGIHKCFVNFKGNNYTDMIKYMTDIQELEFERLGLDFKKIGNRRLQLIDCQNIFCETDKYSRVIHPEIHGLSNRTRIKQLYKPKNSPINYCYPPKWNVGIL